ncbi:MAG: nucleotidyltransferase [Deltaproteobacteria bacterium]|nr:nucleotidyltransferase [Deltaproteobacteria bacterium]
MEANKDFKEFVALLNKNNVRFVIVGGYAVAFHGNPRYTQDIDFLYEPSPENAKKLFKALHDFGFGSLDIAEADFCKMGQVVQLGQPPNRIDLINKVEGVVFEQIWKNKISGTYADQPCFYIGRSELLANKKAMNRPKDQGDLDFLKKK